MTAQQTTDTELADRLVLCAGSFQDAMQRIALQRGESTLTTYRRWREYAEWCRIGDQSPTLLEFERM